MKPFKEMETEPMETRQKITNQKNYSTFFSRNLFEKKDYSKLTDYLNESNSI